MLLEPFTARLVIAEFADQDAVDGRTAFAHAFDVFFRHLANPQNSRPLQSRVREVNRAVAERLVEIAAPDQYQIDNVA